MKKKVKCCFENSSGLQCERAVNHRGYHRAHTPSHTAYWRESTRNVTDKDVASAEKWLRKTRDNQVHI